LDSEPRFDLNVQGRDDSVASRLSVGFPTEKMLLSQISEKLQHWRPHAGGVIRVQLEPETLGMLQVDISIGEKGIVADIIAEHHFVKALMEQNKDLLYETLSAQGIRVDRFSVNVGTPDHESTDRQGYRQDLDVPHSISEPLEEGASFETNKISLAEDSRINLYI
jgi:flagellar hook-length control protein FliK